MVGVILRFALGEKLVLRPGSRDYNAINTMDSSKHVCEYEGNDSEGN